MRLRTNLVAASASLIVMIVTVVISIVTLELTRTAARDVTAALVFETRAPAQVERDVERYERRVAERIADERQRVRGFVRTSELVLVVCSVIGLVFALVILLRAPPVDPSVATESSLLDDLLDALRIEEGAATLARAEWDVDGLICDTVDDLHATAAERGILLRTVPSGLGSVYADRKRVQRALAVLSSHALEQGTLGCEVVVRARPADACIRFEVSAPEAARVGPAPDHAFEIMRFTCKRLVEAHHGTLGLDHFGGRQTFWFTLLTEPACLT